MDAIAAIIVTMPISLHVSPFERLVDVLFFRAGYNATVVVIGTTLLGIACGIIGSFLLLRRRSLVADALSHAALPGVCAGFLLAMLLGAEDLRSLWFLLPGAAVFGLIGVGCVQAISRLPRMSEDAAIGAVLSIFFALGIVLLKAIETTATGSKAGLRDFIFGSAASMVRADVWVIVIIAALAIVIAALLFKELRLLCFDRAFARATGWPTLLLDGLLLALVTAVTVAGIHAVGAILMVALLIIPPAASRFWTDRLLIMILIAAAIGGFGCWAGTAASSAFDDLPTGPAIVFACGCVFAAGLIFAPKRGILPRMVRRWRAARAIDRQHVLRAIYECAEMRGDFETPIPFTEILARRRWSSARLRRLIGRALRANQIERAARPTADTPSFRLTAEGRALAMRIVRSHRLWEHFLTTRADIAPSHVDRAADAIEHVLSGELIAELETSLAAAGRLARSGAVPRSPHVLKSLEPPMNADSR